MDGSAGGDGLVAASIDGAGLVAEGAFVEANGALAAAFGYDGVDALVGTPWTDLYPPPERERLGTEVLPQVRDGQGWRGRAEGLGADGSTFPQVLSVSATGEEGRFAWVVRDCSDVGGNAAADRNGRERELERQRDELATLDRVNEVLFGAIRELVWTADRDAVERVLCGRLVDSGLYEFAWVGEREFDGDRVVPRTTSGEGRGFLEAVAALGDGDGEGGGGPADRAMRTGDVQVVDGPGSGGWHDAAQACGFASTAAVPLRHEGTVYGALLVHTTRESAFSTREREGFDVFGRTIGFVISAIRSNRLLFANTVVELEFRVGGTDLPLERLARDLECELRLEDHVASGRRWVLYLEVDGAAPGDVADAIADEPAVERTRVLGANGGSERVEAVLSESAILDILARLGVSIRTAAADAGGLRFVVEVPGGTDVRELLAQIRKEYPETEFLAQHERDGVATALARADGVLGGLTDRQLETVETAYQAGYFAWPRESTAEDLAASLGLSAATLHGHLRKAEEEVFSTLFDGR